MNLGHCSASTNCKTQYCTIIKTKHNVLDKVQKLLSVSTTL